VTTSTEIDESKDDDSITGYWLEPLVMQSSDLESILKAIPADRIVVASVPCMLDDNRELELASEWKETSINALHLQNTIVGDEEDMDYVSSVVEGVTKKRSKSFNMSGLTGSTNGHFGGVASSTTDSWLRASR